MKTLISILFVMMIVGCGKTETKTETEITEKKVVGTWVTETRHGRYNRYTTLILKATIKPSSDKNASSNVPNTESVVFTKGMTPIYWEGWAIGSAIRPRPLPPQSSKGAVRALALLTSPDVSKLEVAKKLWGV